jgi:hypothetical protein
LSCFPGEDVWRRLCTTHFLNSILVKIGREDTILKSLEAIFNLLFLFMILLRTYQLLTFLNLQNVAIPPQHTVLILLSGFAIAAHGKIISSKIFEANFKVLIVMASTSTILVPYRCSLLQNLPISHDSPASTERYHRTQQ